MKDTSIEQKKKLIARWTNYGLSSRMTETKKKKKRKSFGAFALFNKDYLLTSIFCFMCTVLYFCSIVQLVSRRTVMYYINMLYP